MLTKHIEMLLFFSPNLFEQINFYHLQFRATFSNEVRPLQLEDFASVAMAEVQARNNYKG